MNSVMEKNLNASIFVDITLQNWFSLMLTKHWTKISQYKRGFPKNSHTLTDDSSKPNRICLAEISYGTKLPIETTKKVSRRLYISPYWISLIRTENWTDISHQRASPRTHPLTDESPKPKNICYDECLKRSIFVLIIGQKWISLMYKKTRTDVYH